MRGDRTYGRPTPGARPSGFSLIELMVTISILAVLLGIALPSFTEWIRNNQVRVAAETFREGLQLARSEAVKRNTRMRLNLVTSLDASCALSATASYWIVNAGASVSPVGSCGSAISATATPYVVQASPVTASSTKITVSASSGGTAATVVAFDAAGRMSVTTNPTTTLNKFTVNVGSTAASCLPSGTVRCLQVVVTTAGEVRMCDPAQTSTTDPTSC